MAKFNRKRTARTSLGRNHRSEVLRELALESVNPGVFNGQWGGTGKLLKSISPIDGTVLAMVRTATPAQYEQTVKNAIRAFEQWRTIPPPKRGEVIRCLGEALRAAKSKLGC